MMMMTDYLEDEESILLPIDTRFSVEGYLYDVENLLEPNRDGGYSFSFHPKYAEDYIRILSIAEQARDKILASTPMYSNKQPYFAFENKDGSFHTYQLHAPKVNVELNAWDACLLFGKECSLNLRFHDLRLGKMLLVCDYCDLYEDPTVKPPAPAPNTAVDDDDW